MKFTDRQAKLFSLIKKQAFIRFQIIFHLKGDDLKTEEAAFLETYLFIIFEPKRLLPISKGFRLELIRDFYKSCLVLLEA